MNNIKIVFSILMLSSILFISCKKDSNNDPSPAPSLNEIANATLNGTSIQARVLSAKTNVTTGYNSIYIELKDTISKQRIETALIQIIPMMDMGAMQHSAPVENPVSTNAVSGLFPAAVVFSMPSGQMGSWAIELQVQHNGSSYSATIPIHVSESNPSRFKSFISKTDNSKFFVTLIAPENPKVGVNDLEIAIFKAQNMMSFPADSSLTVSFHPDMPSMGHGSPNNINPDHIGKGHYKGKVNFTMTGLWQMDFKFYDQNQVADSTTFFQVNF